MRGLPLISVVDDDDAVRESLRGLIRSFGFGVETFSSAEDFLRSDFSRTCCLVLDVRMPGMTGVELHRQLRAEHREIPVIFITANGNESTRSQALNEGAVDYLIKPFSDEALLKAINATLVSA
jgi:FixJ family two-component response regulator